MAIKTWFSGLSDPNLEKTAAIKNPDVFIQEEIFNGTGTYASGAGTFTFTGTSFTVDELISAGVDNVLVVDDNGVVASTIITDNTATTITIVPANLTLESDTTTAATLTDTNTYTVRILTPGTSTQAYGKFVGYTEGMDLQITDEFAKFKYSVPRSLKFKDLLERQVILTGGSVNIANEDILKTVFGAVDYGLNDSTNFSLGIGSNPGAVSSFRIWMVGTDRNGGNLIWMVRKGQFESTGSVLGDSESGHKILNFNIDGIADSLYPVNADMVQVLGVVN